MALPISMRVRTFPFVSSFATRSLPNAATQRKLPQIEPDERRFDGVEMVNPRHGTLCRGSCQWPY